LCSLDDEEALAHWGQLHRAAKCLSELCVNPYNRSALPLLVSIPLPLMACVPGAIMAHGDTEVARDDVADVTIIPATKDGDADTKQRLHPEQGKSNHCVNVVHASNIGVRV
jgi:hypothetical protein